MSLGSIIGIAGSGLADVGRALAVVSQNVANASTADYSREVANRVSSTADGVGMGVRGRPTTRDIDTQLQGDLFVQDATVAAAQTRESALGKIDAVQGSPGGGSDLSSLVGKLQDAFSALRTGPENQTQQTAVVAAAQSLASQINAVGGAYTSARQDAQDAIVSGIGALNAALTQIGKLSDRIVQLQAAGQSTADLENQRDQSLHAVSSLVQARFLPQQNGDVLVYTASGLLLPTHGGAALATTGATLGPGAYAPGGGVPAITLRGVDATGLLTGGSIGAAIALRDRDVPTYQASLDEFAQSLSTRFDQQGLTLFTDPTGTVPAGGGTPAQSGYVGYANLVTVNPAVVAQPGLVRDGTHAVVGSPTGAAAFTPNPSGGPAGFTDMIARVLDYALGGQAQSGVAQPSPTLSGLGPAGTLASGFSAPSTLAQFATAVVGEQASASARASDDVTTEQALQTTLQTKLTAGSGVNIDTEMSTMVQLQNAYGANAKVIAAAQTLWDQVLGMVR